tara:strand:+ start:649 stop:873 length:225 start_codon:yes stop_codon:yes gene_type:complete
MSELKRSDTPHTAIVKISISVHKQLKDGSIDPTPVSTSDLNKCGIAPFADLRIDGFDKVSCIKNTLKRLEKLNG